MAHVKVPVALFQGIFGALLSHPVALILDEMKKLQAEPDDAAKEGPQQPTTNPALSMAPPTETPS